MYFRFQEIDTDKHAGKQCTERKYPFVPPADIGDQSGYRKEEGVPEARLPHRAEGRAFQRFPYPGDKGEKDD